VQLKILIVINRYMHKKMVKIRCRNRWHLTYPTYDGSTYITWMI